MRTHGQRIPAGADYEVIDTINGETVMIVRHLGVVDPVECCICGKDTLTIHAVPYYYGPVRSGQSEGGYSPACEPCYRHWKRWDDALTEYYSWFQKPAGLARTGEKT